MRIEYVETVNTGDSNIVRLVNAIFCRALEMQASDIHIEPIGEYSRVRLRLDGLLVELCRLPIIRHNAIVSRIKLLSEMDISEKRLPQDGRLALEFKNRKIDLRIASLPTIEGEKLAIRVLDKDMNVLDLDSIGLGPANAQKYAKLIHNANGLVLVTGPTGSGKTTTLYATLNEINAPSKNIVTLEDPVEYHLTGINQVALNKKIGLDFNLGLSSLVRQDPNIVMLGEIRDVQGATFAVQAALTGHLVFSTLHTNSALGAVNRLLDMGIEPFLLVASLRGVVAQRLVRQICPYCQEEYEAGQLELACLKQEKDCNLLLRRGRGCSYCQQSGYKGRLALQEIMVMDEVLAGMIIRGQEESRQLAHMREQGFQSLLEDGRRKVLQGRTTVEELIRTSIL